MSELRGNPKLRRSLSAELAALEAEDPAVKAAADALRDVVAHLTGRPSRLGIKLASQQRQRQARNEWRNR